MTDLEKAARLVLEKVQEFKARWWKVPPFGNKLNKAQREAITFAHVPVFELEEALRQALEQPAQTEPLAWVREHELPLAPGDAFSWVETFVHKTPLYTSPQRKPWVGLTPRERIMCRSYDPEETVAKTEAKLKEKNT